jgi:hypothetical protein
MLRATPVRTAYVWTLLFGANDERDARQIHSRCVTGEQLGQRPGGESGRPNRVGMRGRAEREGHGQLVRAGRCGAVAVIAVTELALQPVIDERPQLLQRVKYLPGSVTTLTAQCEAGRVFRPRWLGRGLIRRLG